MSAHETEPAMTGDPGAPDEGEQLRQPFRPARVGTALFLGGALWVGPFFGNNAVLLPARLSQIAPDDKVALVAVLAVAGSIVALLANVVFGALSDLTRSRFGRRAPWMIVGSLGSAASLVALSLVATPAALIATWCVFQLFLNAIAAPLIAILPDRVPRARRGTFSALYGVGVLFGAFGSQTLASAYVAEPATGMLVFAALVLIAGPVVSVIMRERSASAIPREKFSGEMISRNFAFPRKNARDFYFALAGKLLFVVGYYAVTGYQLYILTDYIGMPLEDAGAMIATMGLITLVTALIFGFVSGPLSDRMQRRKGLVIGSAVLVAIATMIPFLVAEPWAMIAFAVLGGIGNGAYNSIDQAMNTEVLPSAETAAKDLGILNMANTGGQILGPGVARQTMWQGC